MKRIAVVAAIAVLSSATVFSQTQGDKPAAAPSPGMTGEAKPAAPQRDINIVQGPGQSVVREDARHCLEHSDPTEIIKCAEPYLPTRRK